MKYSRLLLPSDSELSADIESEVSKPGDWRPDICRGEFLSLTSLKSLLLIERSFYDNDFALLSFFDSTTSCRLIRVL
jgi:hypothetical protein